MSDFTASRMVAYCEELLRSVNKTETGEISRELPKYPVLTVFIGDRSMEHFPSVSEKLFELWPQLRNDLVFLAAGSDGRFRTLPSGEGAAFGPEGLEAAILPMFRENSKFDRRGLRLCFVYDSADCFSWEELLRYQELAGQIGAGIRRPQAAFSVVLLRQSLRADREVADRIKDCYRELLYSDAPPAATVLLSSELDDGTALLKPEDWERCHSIIAGLIALTDSDRHAVSGSVMDSRGLYTAGWARVGKPLNAIAATVVLRVLQRFGNMSFASDGSFASAESFPERLGLSPGRTVSLLDAYAERELFRLLPTPAQLECFPRRTKQSIAGMNAGQFNELTMSSWELYLDGLVREAVGRMNGDRCPDEALRAQYTEWLRKHFSAAELIWMSDNMDHVRRCFSAPPAPSKSMGIREYAEQKLRCSLSSHEELRALLLGIIEEQGSNAKKLSRLWTALYESRKELYYRPDDPSIGRFYGHLTDAYLSTHAWQNEFFRISDASQMEGFFRMLLKELVNGRDEFRLDFENELQKRYEFMDGDRSFIASDELIRGLRHNSVVCWSEGMRLPEPHFTAAMLREGTNISKRIVAVLPRGTQVYNTEDNNNADVISVFRLRDVHLVGERCEK